MVAIFSNTTYSLPYVSSALGISFSKTLKGNRSSSLAHSNPSQSLRFLVQKVCFEESTARDDSDNDFDTHLVIRGDSNNMETLDIKNTVAQDALKFNQIDTNYGVSMQEAFQNAEQKGALELDLENNSLSVAFPKLSEVEQKVREAQEEIWESETTRDVHAEGLKDGLGAIESDLNLAAGQLDVAARVVKHGASTLKSLEYINNAIEALEEAIGHSEHVLEYCESHSSVSVENIQKAVEREIRILIDELNSVVEEYS